MHSIFKAAALTFAISISLLTTSCIDIDKTLGADNTPDNQALILQTATLHLPVTTKMMDSVQALNTGYAMLGAIRTSEFGLSTYSFASNFAPFSLNNMDWGTQRKIKSIYLVMTRSSSTTLDDSQKGLPQNIHVYRTNYVVDSTLTYNVAMKPSDYNPTPVDTGSVIYTGTDTLRVWLKNSFGQEILGATQLELDSASKFMNRFKALYFTCDSPDDGVNGGRINTFSSDEAFIYITFNFQPSWQSAKKDTTVALPLVAYNSYIQNLSTYESQAKASSAPMEYIEVEGIGGLKAYLDPIVLKDTLDQWMTKKGYDPKKILIGKATYKLPFVTDNSTVTFINRCYPASLYPHSREWEDNGRYYYYAPLEDIYSSSNMAGDINRSLSYFSGDISSMVQKMASKDKSEIQSNWKQYAMWFSPVTRTTSTSYYSSATTVSFSANLADYHIARLNGPLHSNYPTLEIVYAILND